MKKIYLAWYKMASGESNFGDELSPYIIKKLTGFKVVFMPFVEESIIRNILLYTKLLFFGVISIKGLLDIILYYIEAKSYVIFGIGSIIRKNNYKKSIIWGSGIISMNEHIKESIFLAVRGAYTQKRIAELGFDRPLVLGDPAVLLPVVHPVKSQRKEYSLGIIPHIVHYEEVSSMKYDKRIKVINLKDTIEKVIVDINSCEKTISSSLHGIIVSHVYGIPSLWVSLSETPLGGDDIKFADYFSSVKIKEYLPIKKEEPYSNIWVENLFNNNRHLSLPKEGVILKQQKELLNCAPFKILDKYML